MKVLAAISLGALCWSAEANAADEFSFIACPVYRDTDSGAKSGCWLVDDPATGVRYDVSLAPSKPDWNRAALIEGRGSEGTPDVCGGKVLSVVRASVLDRPCTRHMLEAEGYSGRKFTLPKRNVRPLYEDRVKPRSPYEARVITVPFDFGKTFIVYQLGDYYIDQAINYALDVQPAHVTVTGYASTKPRHISGETIAEPASLARERANVVARALVMRGVPRTSITIKTGGPSESKDEAFDGLAGPSMRRAEVKVEPAPAK